MLLFVLCTMCVLQAADDSQVTFPSLSSETDSNKDVKRAVDVLLSPLPNMSYNIEDLNDYLMPLPLFEQGVQFDDVVIEFGDRITQAVVNAIKIRHKRSSLALLYKKLAKKDLKKMLEDKAVIRYSTKIYDKMCQDQQLIAVFSKAFNVTTKYNLSLEERVQAWKDFRLCAGRVLSDLRKEQLPKIQAPQSGLPDVYVYIDQFLNINNDIVLTKKQQKQYTAYHVILCAVRQIHREYDAKTDDEKMFSLVSA